MSPTLRDRLRAALTAFRHPGPRPGAPKEILRKIDGRVVERVTLYAAYEETVKRVERFRPTGKLSEEIAVRRDGTWTQWGYDDAGEWAEQSEHASDDALRERVTITYQGAERS